MTTSVTTSVTSSVTTSSTNATSSATSSVRRKGKRYDIGAHGTMVEGHGPPKQEAVMRLMLRVTSLPTPKGVASTDTQVLRQ